MHGHMEIYDSVRAWRHICQFHMPCAHPCLYMANKSQLLALAFSYPFLVFKVQLILMQWHLQFTIYNLHLQCVPHLTANAIYNLNRIPLATFNGYCGRQ